MQENRIKQTEQKIENKRAERIRTEIPANTTSEQRFETPGRVSTLYAYGKEHIEEIQNSIIRTISVLKVSIATSIEVFFFVVR